jgi:hypothetical protein
VELVVRLADVNPNSVRPGWIALLIVLGLAVATFLLWRNMGKQMRKIDFEEEPDTDRSGHHDRTDHGDRADRRPEGNGSTG